MAIPDLSIPSSSEKTGKLDRTAFFVFFILLVLTPLFLVPSLSVPFQTGKTVFIIYGIIITFGLWCLGRLKDGLYAIPKTYLAAGAGLLALVYTLAALFSVNQGVSLYGFNFELGSLSFFLSSLVLFLIIPLVVRSQKDIFHSYIALLVSFLLIGLFHIVRFVSGTDALSFGMFTSVTANLIGKWNDLGVFFGLGAIFSMIALERGQLSRFVKLLHYVLLLLSLVMLVIVNFSLVWTTLAVLSLIYLIYEISFGKKSLYLGARLPYHTMAVLIISVMFIFAGAKIGDAITNSLGTSQIEVRPSWSATAEVAEKSLRQNLFLGAGPNRFSNEWLLYKPAGINNTVFWNVDFNYGIGFIPSFLSTTGIIGLLAILLFAGLFLVKSVRTLFKEDSQPFPRFLVLTSLFGSIYLWVFSFVYVPSTVIWILTMALSGLFVASLREDGSLKVASISVIDKPAASFISVLLTILLLIGALAFGYFVTMRLISGIYFQKAVAAVNTTGNLDQAITGVGRAITFSPSDIHYQSLSEIYLAKINTVLSDRNLSQTEVQRQFQQYLSAAIQSAQEAIRIDPTNYRNYLSQGRIFEAVVPLNIEGAYDNAKKLYESALALNPESPEIYLILARLETAHKDNKAAKDFIVKSLEKKSDYADAIFLLSQIQIAENDVPNAVRSVEAVATLSPSDPGVFFQLGLLYYNQKNYQNAVLALERAVSLNPQYANAKYFLGLSYYQTGEKQKSLEQFTDLQVTNVDNNEIKAIITNLKADKAPLFGQSAPERRSSAPVSESSTREEI